MAWETIKIPNKRGEKSPEYLAGNATGSNNSESFIGIPVNVPVGDVVSNSKTVYGAPTVMPDQVDPNVPIETQGDIPTNQFDTDPRQTTGSLGARSSYGTDQAVDTTELGAGRLAQRLELLKGSGNNVGINLNDPSVYSV